MIERLKIFQDDESKWRWALYGKNGKAIAESTQGYASRQRARGNLRQVTDLLVKFGSQPKRTRDGL